MKTLPVIATIPAYNAESTLGPLLEDVLAQEYDDIYVLDDASSDHTLEVAYGYSRDVVVVEGETNLGSGGNRNRIIPEIGHSALIHFLDADVRLNSRRTPEKASELGSRSDIGFVGGLIRDPDGRQMAFNYGPSWYSVQGLIGWLPQSYLHNLAATNDRKAAELRRLAGRLLEGRPDPAKEPTPTEVYWSSEANLIIRSEVFKRLGGYDASLRYSEIFEFAHRVGKAGLRKFFDPAIDVTHYGQSGLGEKLGGESLRAFRKLLLNSLLEISHR